MADLAVSKSPTAASAAAPDAVVVRFAGDSGDGMQLTGGQFTLSTALAGNDLATFPDFPAEIRAPQGTLFGVSAFQINFGSSAIETAGDQPDVLVAMNPAVAELVANLVYQVAHPELSAVLVALVVASAHLPLALAVGSLVELVVVAKVESVEQAQVALLVQHL